ncbi:MAG: sulfite exporter TauE/SafE family protein [Proteobacteria bacterium]|nr:sulfite exporter TauE/SafE family protein [Pseudomonadota bacterium]
MIIQLFEWLNFSGTDWAISVLCGILIGTAKAGIAGTGLMIVPIMAYAFGGRVSTGIVLPMLIVADMFAVRHYHRHADWKVIGKIMPWALMGILMALVVGHQVSDGVFKRIMSVTVLCGIAFMIWQDIRKRVNTPDYWWFAGILGLAGGFATMIGNAAGPIMAMYLLAMRIPKYGFIGTSAWFFFLINLFKVPLHILFWKTISIKTLAFDLMIAPAIVAGVFLGIQIVRIIPDKLYRTLVIGTTVVSAFLLL